MRYTETIKVHSAKTEPIAEFLAANGMVKQLADGANPIDWLAGQFLPDAGREEGYGDWIARQAQADARASSPLATSAFKPDKKASNLAVLVGASDWIYSSSKSSERSLVMANFSIRTVSPRTISSPNA